jgi:hypothetical protein
MFVANQLGREFRVAGGGELVDASQFGKLLFEARDTLLDT